MLRANQEMSSKLRLTIACYVLTSMLCAQVASAATIFYDDFGDGNAGDGTPVTWVPSSGTWNASSGDYVATGSLPSRISRVSDRVFGDISARTQARVVGNVSATLAVRQGNQGYAGSILPDGIMAIVRLDAPDSPIFLGSAVVSFNPVEQDVMLQFDAFDDELSLWAWPMGEPMPTEPQVVAFDNTYAEGPVGLVSAAFAAAPTDSTTFRFIHVADTHIPGLPGDFNSNGILDVGDIDELTTQTAAMSHPSAFDLNSDALVNSSDVNIWIQDLFHSWIGDANLDGEFNSSDLVTVLATGTYEVDVNSVWSTGDFNGDGRTNSSDLVVALADGGYEMGPRPAVASVPEPASSVLVLGSLIGIATRRRHVGR